MRAVLLVLGVGLIADVVATPGQQFLEAVVAGALLALYDSAISRKGRR